MKDPQSLLNEYKDLKGEREQYVTQEPMSMEELDLASQVATEEPVSSLGMEEADRLDNMLKEYKDTPEWLREADQEREALQAQQDVDDLDFGTAFDTHYEQYKELPREQRPKLTWRGREYLPVKSEELEPDTDLSKTLIERPKEEPKKETKPSSEFKTKLGQRESSNNYKAVNQLGYLGKYQFGGMALQDLGYKDSKGNWTGKDGIESKEDFLNNSDVQEKAMDNYMNIQKRYLKSKGATKYIGKEFNGIPVTEQGLIAAAHLVGAGAVNKMLNSGKIPKDANGVKATEYLKMFSK